MLHISALWVRSVLKSPTCYIFGALFKNAPKTHLPTEINGDQKRVKNAIVFLVRFLSHMFMFHRCMQGVRQPEKAAETHENHIINAYVCVKGPIGN